MKWIRERVVMSALILLAPAPCVTAQAIAPLEYPPSREPYYYYNDNMPWYDSYGRLRYGPRGIPARLYGERQDYENRRTIGGTGYWRKDQGVERGEAGRERGGY